VVTNYLQLTAQLLSMKDVERCEKYDIVYSN